jgi:hypothetical protein
MARSSGGGGPLEIVPMKKETLLAAPSPAYGHARSSSSYGKKPWSDRYY